MRWECINIDVIIKRMYWQWWCKIMKSIFFRSRNGLRQHFDKEHKKWKYCSWNISCNSTALVTVNTFLKGSKVRKERKWGNNLSRCAPFKSMLIYPCMGLFINDVITWGEGGGSAKRWHVMTWWHISRVISNLNIEKAAELKKYSSATWGALLCRGSILLTIYA